MNGSFYTLTYSYTAVSNMYRFILNYYQAYNTERLNAILQALTQKQLAC